jgi:O-antigen/teichoic acid export membrane protein
MPDAGRTTVFKGALLTVSMRWTDRLIGFVSTLILARLLAPADFGIIAMASLVVGLVDALLALGVHVALIRNLNATPAHYNTAWTLRLAQSAIAATAIFLAAPKAAIYFSDPRVIPVLRFMALGMLLMGIENIGIVTFQKEMRFGLDFRFLFLKRVISFLITIAAAWVLRSYWALVIGNLAGRGVGVLLSYQMHSMRPRFSLEKLREIFSVSQWMLLDSIGSYLNRNLDKVLVGRRADATIVGGYTLASEISAMPSTEVLAPLNRVLFPAFVGAKHDLAELKRLYLLAQGVQSLLGISAGVGLALVAPEAVLVLLGAKWLFVVPFVRLLALTNAVEAITTSGGYVLITLGKIKSAVLINWLQVIFFAVGVFLLLPGADALQMASIRVVTVLAGFFLSVWMLIRTLSNVSLLDIVRTVSRPLLATVVMAAAVISIGEATHFSALFELLLKVAVGMLTFPTAVILMWMLAGRPRGPESYLLDKAQLMLAKRKNQ